MKSLLNGFFWRLVAAVLLADQSAPGQCAPAWTPVTGQPPAGRSAAAVAFDTARGVAVIFGGILDGNQVSGETWEWNGVAWRLAATAGPSPRCCHAMAFDAARGVVVLFGGSMTGGSSPLGDTWEWNGTAWLQRDVPGPAPRSYHAMAFDSVRRRTLLFGGIGPSVPAQNPETWEWDGQQWVLRLIGGGPQSGRFPVLAFDTTRGVMNLTGGGLGLWEWDGAAWQRRATTGPALSTTYQGAFDASRGRTVVIVRDDVHSPSRMHAWEWDGTTWRDNVWIDPTPRFAYATAYDPVRAAVLFYGGSDSSNLPRSDLWAYRGPGASEILGPPSARVLPAMAYDASRDAVVLFGGYTFGATSEAFLADTWEWHGGVWSRRSVGGPSPREKPAMAYDIGRGVMVLFGGMTTGLTSLHDTWEWDGARWTQRATTGPPGYSDPAMIYDRDRHVCTLLDSGALIGGPTPADTWEWNGSTWTRRASTGPLGGGMAYDAHRHVTVALSGEQTWEWNGLAWINRGIPGPVVANSTPALTFDEHRGRTIAFSGWIVNGQGPAETWEYDGTSWTRRLQGGPPARRGYALVYDSLRGLTLLFGGYENTGLLGDTWVYRADEWVGDLDANCVLGRADSRIFVNALLGNPIDPAQLARADLNGDGVVDADDIQAFTAIRVGP